jgi:hypothetical protein
MHAEDRAHATGALANHGFRLDCAEARGLGAQDVDLRLGEQLREHEEAVALVLHQLLRAELHGADASTAR